MKPGGKPQAGLVELEVVDVLHDEDRGPRALLRSCAVRGKRRATGELVVPLGIVEATHLHCLLTGRRLERPSWQGLYLTSLAAAGMEVAAVELESRPSLLTAAVFVRSAPGGKRAPAEATVAIAAPTDAALLLAYEVRAPIYATAETARAFARERGGDARGREAGGRQAGAALLADLLAHLPDEDFGKWKM